MLAAHLTRSLVAFQPPSLNSLHHPVKTPLSRDDVVAFVRLRAWLATSSMSSVFALRFHDCAKGEAETTRFNAQRKCTDLLQILARTELLISIDKLRASQLGALGECQCPFNGGERKHRTIHRGSACDPKQTKFGIRCLVRNALQCGTTGQSTCTLFVGALSCR